MSLIDSFLKSTGNQASPAPMTQNPQNNSLPTSLNDPRMNNVKDYVNSHGGNPKTAFYNLCKEKMLNPAEIINRFIGGRNGY